MNLANFKVRVAAYLNREATSFVTGGVDNVLEAINDARRDAQLKYDFNFLKDTGYLTVPQAGVLWSANVKDAVGGASLPVSRISEVWTFDESTTPPSPLKRLYMDQGSDSDRVGSYGVRLEGQKLWVTGQLGQSTYMVKVTKWLPDLTDAVVNDFFLEYGGTWLLYQTIQNLNLYLKEDSRVQIADSVVQRAWTSLVSWDGSQAINDTSRHLD